MRTTLLGSLVDVLKRNHFRKISRIRVFEIGRAYLRDAAAADGPLAVAGLRQPVRIAGAAFGPALEEQWGAPSRQVDFFDVKADIEMLCAPLDVRVEAGQHPAFHPGRSGRVLVEGKPAGWLGELHPRLQQKYELPAPPVLFEALEIPEEGNHEKSLRQLNEEYYPAAEGVVIEKVKAALLAAIASRTQPVENPPNTPVLP